jgi:hypothetical protein
LHSKHSRRAVQNKDVYRLCTFSSGWPNKSADAQNALGRHSRTLAQVSALHVAGARLAVMGLVLD